MRDPTLTLTYPLKGDGMEEANCVKSYPDPDNIENEPISQSSSQSF